MRLAVVATKGGVGKTTVAALLALAAARTGARVLALDADPQGSLTSWARDAAGLGELVTVTPLPSARRIARELDRLAAGADHVVLDCPPGRGDEAITSAAMVAAELVVVPMAPTLADLDRLGPTLDLAAGLDRPAVVVVNRARASTRSTKDTLAALAELDVPTLSVVVPLAERVAWAFGTRSVPPPFPALWDELVALDRALRR